MTASVKQKINVVWFKRDLRLSDHEPLLAASQDGLPVLLIYVFEPMLLADAHYDVRHWRFVWQSVKDMRQQLKPLGGDIHVSVQSMSEALKNIQQVYVIEKIFSHQEIGLNLTYERDKHMQKWCAKQGIEWHESPTGAVVRGLKDRSDWDKDWKKIMRAEIQDIPLKAIQWVSIADVMDDSLFNQWQQPNLHFQMGGSEQAMQTLDSFFEERGQHYHKLISKPEHSRTACSRMSPYLAWGNISLREMYQQLLSHWNRPYWRRALAALSSRLHWHCHFIQKFESECRMEFEPLNRGFDAISYRDDCDVEADLHKWKYGQTGFPLVDACMRCLHETGYINFRMRAMLVSFLCHNLRIDWRRGVKHLARMFLDFEPGIHYAQFQMQAGLMGVNTVRIYNVNKQAKDHDPEGQFIKRWVSELSAIPDIQVHEPWLLTALEQQLYGFDIHRDYHMPCVDIQSSARESRQLLYGWRKKPQAQAEIGRILAQHVRVRKKIKS
ncbi:deoxyribodipyrimidine photo-lyase/cryptochrome family protein [Marinicella sp. W31]|uniref:cryptochrome/deoxyribodipyrimidine photo-lyase family protein n=1 Tax=Marinicella sp. W31 TaxID=3023713 RepID=UPI0037567ABB